MKILIYNIAYGTGSPGGERKRMFKLHRYIATPHRPFGEIMSFINSEAPDVVGLIEADAGSFRTKGYNHIAKMAEHLGDFHYNCASKYGDKSVLNRLPLFRHQHNALLSKSHQHNALHYMSVGSKKLIVSSRVDGVHILLVHLSLRSKVRRRQLCELSKLIIPNEPTIVAGDFNTFKGEPEIIRFIQRKQFKNANTMSCPTYPAWSPFRQLDYILYSKELELENFTIPRVEFSDHLPLIANFHKKNICNSDTI